MPNAATSDRFIEDKLGEGDFIHHETRSTAFLVNASAWALGLSARVIQPGETPDGTIGRLVKRLGAPAVRAATRQAMRLMGSHFVLGETIEAALARAKSDTAPRYSFDMLGEGARTADDAERYFQAYARAIEAIGKTAGTRALPDRPGISIKLSALHPRFEAVSRQRVMTELVPRLIDLGASAKSFDLNLTVDAEEADRLELSLEVIAAAFSDSSLAGWDGFGLAIQAYQKRASAVIDYTHDLAVAMNRRMMVRLVKGAYWDTEVKRAQERGLSGYPVFTRKAMTDLNYTACAERLLSLRPRLFPQFATHNALTVASVLDLAGNEAGFELQRLHGMGEALYAQLIADHPQLACRTYAPVGSHRDLLAYLVRRLLENGANSSFVALAADDAVPVSTLLRRPSDIIGSAEHAPPPEYSAARRSLPAAAAQLARAGIRRPRRFAVHARGGQSRNHARSRNLPDRWDSDHRPDAANFQPQRSSRFDRQRGRSGHRGCCGGDDGRPLGLRRLEPHTRRDPRQFPRTRRRSSGNARGALHRVVATRGGKTLDDAISEVREAADFCRYYAAQGRRLFGSGETMPGPDRREQCVRPARPRRVRRDLAVEFSARDLHGPDHRGLDGRQCRGGQTCRADAADCVRGRAFAA